MMKRFVLAAGLVLALAGCQDDRLRRGSGPHLAPIPPDTLALMSTEGHVARTIPIVIRAYKKESEMEIWKRGSDGSTRSSRPIPICRWSGQLGPKTAKATARLPRASTRSRPAQMNPNSAYYLSFDTGYPNAYDRAIGRTARPSWCTARARRAAASP